MLTASVKTSDESKESDVLIIDSLDKLTDDIIARFFINRKQLQIFRETPRENLCLYHFSLGMFIRNNYAIVDKHQVHNLLKEISIWCSKPKSKDNEINRYSEKLIYKSLKMKVSEDKKNYCHIPEWVDKVSNLIIEIVWEKLQDKRKRKRSSKNAYKVNSENKDNVVLD